MIKPSEIFNEILAKFGDFTLLRDEYDGQIKYSDISNYAGLDGFRKSKRTVVLCLVANDLGGIAGYLSLLAAGAVPLMAGITLSPEAVNGLVMAYHPDFVWLPESRVAQWPNAHVVASLHGYCLIELPTGDRERHSLHAELCLLLSTSGSTGASKYVRLSHENVWENAASIANYLQLTANDVPITTLPPNYSYGLSVVHSHLWVGATLAVTNKSFFDKKFWSFLRESGATSMAGVPYHYEILKKLRFSRMDLPSLRTLTQAGGRMEPALTREFAEHCNTHGIRFFTMYGQTEATARMSYVPAEQAVVKAGTVGVPVPGGLFELRDEDGVVIESPDTTGELIYRGPNVCMGYAETRADLSREDENHGVLKTGDLAQYDNDGYCRIVGRKNRFIKLFGNRINLQEVEKYLAQDGLMVACAGEDDRLEVYVETDEVKQAQILKQSLINWLQVSSQGLSVYGVESLPRSEAGKVRYSELQPITARLLV